MIAGVWMDGQDKVSAGGSWDHTAAQGSDTNSRGHPEPWRSTSLLYKEDEVHKHTRAHTPSEGPIDLFSIS